MNMNKLFSIHDNYPCRKTKMGQTDTSVTAKKWFTSS